VSAILATKLGMTQVFKEDGSVERVTVLAAGPCPVTAVRTAERDGYDAIQLAFGPVRSKQLSKPSSGTCRRQMPSRSAAWSSSAKRPSFSSATR